MRALRRPVGVAGLGLLALVLFVAAFGPVLWGERATVVDTGDLLAGPSAEHWIGTDNLGRDLFARVMVAARLSILLALAATAISLVLGIALGAAPMLVGRRLGRLITSAVNVLVAFPGLLLVLFFAVVFGVGARGAALAVGLAGAPAFARLCHTLVAAVSERDYVAAARIAGVSRVRVLLRHVLPNIAEPLIVNATMAAGGVLLTFAGLSFLGLGVQAPSYDWGKLMQDGLNGIYVHPLAALGPGIAVVLAGLAFNLTGEAFAAAPGRTRPLEAAREPAARTAPVAGTSLSVDGLRVTIPGPAGPIHAVRGVTFTVGDGEAVGVVGESGSGKSVTALAVAGLLEPPIRVDANHLVVAGEDLMAAGAHRRLGTSLAVVFQDPMTSFNPAHRVGPQLAEVSRFHQGMSRKAAFARAVDRLRAVRIGEPGRRARQYPFEFSGGMRQRAMIGMGLMGDPRLIIADEPTTALDVTVQRQVLELLAEVRRDTGAALLLISHDVTVVTDVCDRVLVMYAGRVVEELPAKDLRTLARHPYTRALVAAVPDMETDLNRPLAVIPGLPVDPTQVPSGCAFAPRCPFADDHCRAVAPALVAGVACHKSAEVGR
ncbi:dipeptide/oligopeptide/nickel ABC transporter permease/ATP-binding protein [Sphaerisporangium sp. TRM90804]|uniref:dipeptide/oligopeptide/nickel ABC transporter permease/ATP-binding protein n=1 Tax=Sphaerisporangium sp. TRM90804 TaxID=3031113 RepID=UPI00244C38AB|nr:dipeptide/oligopeptide/nickel ABC transporter permease/ATP-binding protein [Sphaerisporangium sp. TRM90804]MDH2425582.1 dipeptide/oligopeptide/nickel ABC transporter permease/ATP-binding protein [Sphaerisporangium sp. TRM90804]